MPRHTIGILFGGCSEEHPVSVKSAREVARHLDLAAYEPVWVGITRQGEWRLCDGPHAGWEDGLPAVLSPDRAVGGLLVLDAGGHRTVPLDLVLPVLHGRCGEDGAVQGLLELAGLPYVGCDVSSSALCMDKSLTYLVARSAGIATPKHWTVSADGLLDPGEPTFPVFVKPARSGSSYGVAKVDRPDQLPEALEAARRFDSKVLVEEAVVGLEVGCAVLGDGEDLVTGEVDRISLSHGFFRVHQETSPEEGSENSVPIVPADIPAELRARVRETARVLYRALGCRGLSRVDLFLTDDERLVLNEVNTMPGLTSYSRYPRMMAAAGLSLGDVIDRLASATLAGRGR